MPVPFDPVTVNVTLEPEIADCVAGATFILFTLARVNHSDHNSPSEMMVNNFFIFVV